jgi:protein AroM
MGSEPGAETLAESMSIASLPVDHSVVEAGQVGIIEPSFVEGSLVQPWRESLFTIGFVTIAESPRDDVVPDIVSTLPGGLRVVERGNLDGLTDQQIADLAPDAGKSGIVARLKAGGETLLDHQKILPRMQSLVDELVRDEGVDLVIVLCGADWTAIRCPVPLINPGRVFPAVVSSLAYGRRLGVIKPNAG